MKAIHPLHVALALAFSSALACTSDFPAGIDHRASGGSGPAGGHDAGAGGAAGATSRDVDSATAVGGAVSGGTSGGTTPIGIGTGGATGGGGTASGSTSVVVDAAGTNTGGAPSSGGAGGSGLSPDTGVVGADAALDVALGVTPDLDNDWAKDSGSDAHDGGSTPDSADASVASHILDLFPRNNSIAGWTVDPDYPGTAALIAVTATTQAAAENLIDGAAADFFGGPNPPVIFAWQNYVNMSLPGAPPPDGAKLSLFIMQMAGTQQAAGLYDYLRSATLYASSPWVDPSAPLVGTRSRIADTGDRWWINFYKGTYYVEVNLSPSYGPAPDYVPGNANTRTAALQFAQTIASAM